MGLVVDLFAGGGGASTGMEMALGRSVDIAINHDPIAIAVHRENHPNTKHYISDIYEVDPIEATKGEPVDVLWASPDCKHFSKAKGGVPLDNNIRSLAWVVIKWAKACHPRFIFLENVEEFKTWGPLKNQKPDPDHKGETFLQWVQSLKDLGYSVDWRELRACDYGAPTSRKRLFLVARNDGMPILWPNPTHADPKKNTKLKPWKTAAECIDWSIECPSIFDRKKPLAEATMNRIAAGIKKFILNNPQPFVLSIANWSSNQMNGVDKPLTTITANPKGGHHALVSPTLIQVNHSGDFRGQELTKVFPTVTTKNGHALVAPVLIREYGNSKGADINKPLPTITQVDHSKLVVAFLAKHFTGAIGQELDKPMPTITAIDHNSLVTVELDSETYAIVDIGLRMLQPKELYKAQGFPDDYKYKEVPEHGKLSKKDQVRLCGNSVSPLPAKAVVGCNINNDSDFMFRKGLIYDNVS